MAVLKQTSPTAEPVAPKPMPSSTVPSASTSSAVGLGSSQSPRFCALVCGAPVCGCVAIAKGLNVPGARLPLTGPNWEEAIAVLRDDINNAMKAAMKAGQARRVSTLRLINAAILPRETSGAERLKLNDAEILDVMGKMIKQRQESLDIYEKAGRAELAQQERDEIGIISAYLPQQLSDMEAGVAISSLIKELEAATLKDMGRTMTALKDRYAGRMDFSKASALVKKLLAG